MYKNSTSLDEILSCVKQITDIVPWIVFPDYAPIIIVEWEEQLPSLQDVEKIRKFLQKFGETTINDLRQHCYISIVVGVQ